MYVLLCKSVTRHFCLLTGVEPLPLLQVFRCLRGIQGMPSWRLCRVTGSAPALHIAVCTGAGSWAALGRYALASVSKSLPDSQSDFQFLWEDAVRLLQVSKQLCLSLPGHSGARCINHSQPVSAGRVQSIGQLRVKPPAPPIGMHRRKVPFACCTSAPAPATRGLCQVSQDI
jgi:hypothetical protein